MARAAAAAIERHRAAEEAGGVDAAEHDVGVGHGGLGAAARVAHGAGIGARALRAEGERAARVDPGDGAAAGAHLLDVDHRDAQRVAVHVVLVRGLDEAAVDDGALRGRAAHVERDEPVRAEDSREARAARGARRRPRLHRVHGLRPGRLEREGPAIGLRDEHLAAEAAPAEGPAERAEVAVHDGPDVGVDDGGARPLVLPPLLRDPMRRRDGGAGQLAARRSRRPAARGPGRDTRRGRPPPRTRRPRRRAGARRSLTASSSRGTRISPRAPRRSGTSRQRPRGTSGAGRR